MSNLLYQVSPGDSTGGVTISPAMQLAALDVFGNTITAFTGDVTLAIDNNPAGGSLSGTVTVTAAAGVATFSDLSIDQAGTGYDLIATTSSYSPTTSVPFDITVGPAVQLTFTAEPTDAAAGQAIAPAVEVTAQDAGGNADPTFGGTVMIVIGTNPSGGTLTGTTTIVASSGVVSASDLSIDTMGVGYTLVASSAGLSSATSANFDITLGSDLPPTVSIASPANAATVSGTITITGTAADDIGVTQVEVNIGGAGFVAAAGTTSWSHTLDTTALPDGSLTIVARATDTGVNTTTDTITVTVSNGGGTVMNLNASPRGECSIDLSWQNPATLSGVLILRSTSATPAFVPVNTTTYPLGNVGAGEDIIYSGAGNSLIDAGLLANTQYFYFAYVFDGTPAYSTSVSANGTTDVIAAPTFVSADPADGQRDVLLTGVIAITFSEAMDPTLTDAVTTLNDFGVVPFTTVWTGDTVVITPTAPLSEGTDYTLTVGGGATDECGNAIAGPVTLNFTTRTVGPGLFGGGCGTAATSSSGGVFTTTGNLLTYLLLGIALYFRRRRQSAALRN